MKTITNIHNQSIFMVDNQKNIYAIISRRDVFNLINKCTIALFFLVQSLFCLAKQVTKEESLNIAQQFYKEHRTSKVFKVKSATIPEFKLDYISTDVPKALNGRSLAPAATDTIAYYYVYNIDDNQGFIIVSGDDRTTPVLGYSDEGKFTYDNIPEHIKAFMDNYRDQIKTIMHRNDTTVLQKVMKVVQKDTAVAPLITTKWGQDAPYNSMIPITASTGCVATAMAQVMNYYKWPVKGISSLSYYWGGVNFSANFGSTTYDWANMLDTYSLNDNTSSVTCQAVATLAYHCGVSLEMEYAADASGAPTSSVPDALINYFGYDNCVKYIASDTYTPSQWKYQMMLEIESGRPVLVAGYQGEVGHTYIADGYDSYEFIHLNWGWNGLYNGYFEINPLDGSVIYQPRGMVIGIQKPLATTETTLCYQGFNLSDSLNQKRNLPLSVNISVFGVNGKNFNGEIGLAFYQNDVQYKILNTTTSIINSGSTLTNGFIINIPDTISLGTYRLVPIFKPINSNIWSEIKYKNTTLATDTRTNENVEFVVSENDIAVYQNSKTMHCKNGEFKSKFTYDNWSSIKRLVVSGEIDQWDLWYMAGCRSIRALDINKTTILNTIINPADVAYGGTPANYNELVASLSSKWKKIYNNFWHGIQYKQGDPNWKVIKGGYTSRGLNYDPISKTYYATYDKNPEAPDYTKSQLNVEIVGQQGLIITIGGKGIMADAFCNSSVESVTLPSSLKYIAPMAFANCPNLKTIALPDSVILIGDSLFYNCPNLTKITFTKNLKEIWNQNFSNLKNLTTVILPDSLKSIDENTFYNCTGLTSVTLPTSLNSIGDYAFTYCTHLTNFIIPSSVTKIGESAFSECRGLTSIIIPSSVNTIESNTFIDCSGLTSVSMPNSVTSIDEYAFASCKGLTSIVLPLSVSSIGDDAFISCSGLTGVLNIPKSVFKIGYEAFSLCSNLSGFNVQDGNLNYSSTEGVLFNKNKTTLINFPGAKQGNYSIPNSVTTIESRAFYACSGLTSITIPSSVTSIGYSVFRNCSSLTSIYVRSKPVDLNSSSSQSIFNGVDKSSCTLYVPYKAKVLYATAIQWKDFMNIVEDSQGFLLDSNAVNFTATANSKNISIIANVAWTASSDQTWLTVSPSSNTKDCTLTLTAQANQTAAIRTAIVTVLSGNVASQTITITQIGLPKSINVTAGGLSTALTTTELNGIMDLTITGTIDARDFKTMRDNMPLLTKLDLLDVSIATYTGTGGTSGTINTTYPENVIPNYAFYIPNSDFSNMSLKRITIPSSVTSIGNSAFSYCRELTSVIITNSNISIGDSAFFICDSLKYIKIPKSVMIPNSFNSIGRSAFNLCKYLTNFIIPSSVISIGEGAFFGSGLNSVIIPNSVTSIGSSAFQEDELTYVIIPNSVTSIGSDAFGLNIGLKAIYAYSTTPIDLSYSSNVFYLFWSLPDCTLYVPKGSISAYKAAVQWKDFPKIVELKDFALSTNEVTIPANGNPMSVTITSNTTWNASSDQTWLTFISESGSGNGTLILKATVNYGIERSASVTIIPTDAPPQTIVVTQEGIGMGENIVMEEAVRLYPNPMTDGFRLSGLEGKAKFTLTDISGKLLLSKEINVNEFISLNMLQQGIYIARIITADGTFEKKLIKK